MVGTDGALERIRTSGPKIRNFVLYPTELRARIFMFRFIQMKIQLENGSFLKILIANQFAFR